MTTHNTQSVKTFLEKLFPASTNRADTHYVALSSYRFLYVGKRAQAFKVTVQQQSPEALLLKWNGRFTGQSR
jgi:hypothetical protein